MKSKFPLFYSIFQAITKVSIHFCTHTKSCYKIAGIFGISSVGVHCSYLGVTGCFSILGDGKNSGLGSSCPLFPVASYEAIMSISFLSFSTKFFTERIFYS